MVFIKPEETSLFYTIIRKIKNYEYMKGYNMFNILRHNNINKSKNSIKILAIADIHYDNERYIKKILAVPISSYDIIIILGDVRYTYLKAINSIDKLKVGVLGNHDDYALLQTHSIENIHGKTINHNGLKISGFEGIPKYEYMDSRNTTPGFTQKDALKEIKSIRETDILISHTGPIGLYDRDVAHCGYKAVSRFLKRKKVALNIHGHFHRNTVKKLRNGTVVIGIYGASIIDTKDYSIKQIIDNI